MASYTDKNTEMGSNEFQPKAFSLGNGKNLTYGMWKGQERIDIRIWKGGDSYPTKDGVVFPLKRYVVLRRSMPEITDALKEVMDGKPDIGLRIHLGGNVHASVTAPYACVNLRKWFTKYDQLRPGRGITLHAPQWTQLCKLDEDILDEAIPKLPTTTECAEQPDHHNLNCLECCPDGYLF